MKRPGRSSSEPEQVALDYLKKNTVMTTIQSSEMKMYRHLLLNKEWTIHDWEYLLNNFSEKELIRDWFCGDKFAFEYYRENAHDKTKMKMFMEKGFDPHHIDENDLNGFYADMESAKSSSATDHEITKELDKERIGQRGLDFQIDMIIMNQYHGAEFTPEGLQSFAELHGHAMTLQNAKTHAEKINRMLRKIRMMDPRKTGLVDIENEMEHELKKYARKNRIDATTLNMLILHGKKMISIMCPSMGRNIAKSMTPENKKSRVRNFVQTIKKGADFLGLELNDVISQMINESRKDEV